MIINSVQSVQTNFLASKGKTEVLGFLKTRNIVCLLLIFWKFLS